MFVRRTVFLSKFVRPGTSTSLRFYAKYTGYDSADYDGKEEIKEKPLSMPRLEDLPVEDENFDFGDLPVNDNDPEAKIISKLIHKVARFDTQQKKKWAKLEKEYDQETLQGDEYQKEIEEIEKEAAARNSLSQEQQEKAKLETAKFLARRLKRAQATPEQKPEEESKENVENKQQEETVGTTTGRPLTKMQAPTSLYEELEPTSGVNSQAEQKTDKPSDIVQRIFGSEKKKEDADQIPQDRKKTVAFKVTLDQIPTVMHSSKNWINTYQNSLATKPKPHKEFSQSFYLIKN